LIFRKNTSLNPKYSEVCKELKCKKWLWGGKNQAGMGVSKSSPAKANLLSLATYGGFPMCEASYHKFINSNRLSDELQILTQIRKFP
jgi:hypothetical protein